MMGFWKKADGGTSGSRGRRSRNRPVLECLEKRELLTTGTQPYLLTGDRWSNATPITFSIAADGVTWDRMENVLNAVMDARFVAGTWQDEIARALQTWASVANINFVRVADSALAWDTVGKAQGDARFGDIRFGGYDFGNTSQLAHAYTPPPNGSTAAGDVAVNTAMAFNIGSQYDLYSVLLHEAGHSLGLDHPDNLDAVMLATYSGVRTALDAGDIAGIQAIYGARIDDIYGQQGRGSGLSDAVDVSAGSVTPTLFDLRNLSLTARGDSDYFSVVAPTSGASLRVMAIAGGVSMLSAQVSVYDASGALLDLKGDGSSYGQNVTAGVAGVVAGQRYYIKVSGATDDVFSIGSYGLEVRFDGGQPPAIPSPPPVIPVPTPPVLVAVVPPSTPPVVPAYTPPSTPPVVPAYTPPSTPPVVPAYTPPSTPPVVPAYTPPSTPPQTLPDAPTARVAATPGRVNQTKNKKTQRQFGQPRVRRRMPRFPGGGRMQAAAPPPGRGEIFEAAGRAVVG